MAHPLVHEERVDAWSAALDGAPPVRLVDALSQVVAALWRRSQRTLGDVTVRAIVGRVVATVAARHPRLDALEVTDEGVRFDALRAAAESDALGAQEARAAARDLLIELLTVLCALTADVLTPALHAELATVEPSGPGPDTVEGRALGAGAAAPTPPRRGDGAAPARGGGDDVNDPITRVEP